MKASPARPAISRRAVVARLGRLALGMLGCGHLAIAKTHDEPKMPRALRINGRAWFVLEVPKIGDDPHKLGHTDAVQCVVLLRAGQSEAMKAETMVHEIEHAFTCDGRAVHNERFNNNPGNQDDHPGIYWSANQWHRFMVENQAFMKWVMSAGLPGVELQGAE